MMVERGPGPAEGASAASRPAARRGRPPPRPWLFKASRSKLNSYCPQKRPGSQREETGIPGPCTLEPVFPRAEWEGSAQGRWVQKGLSLSVRAGMLGYQPHFAGSLLKLLVGINPLNNRMFLCSAPFQPFLKLQVVACPARTEGLRGTLLSELLFKVRYSWL